MDLQIIHHGSELPQIIRHRAVTYSMEQSLFWEASQFSACLEIPARYGTRRFIAAFTRGRQPSLSWARSH